MNLKKIALCVIGFAVSASIYAAPKTSITCPDANTIKMVFFDDAIPDTLTGIGSEWGGIIKNNKFGTENEWSFLFGAVVAPDKESALKELNKKVQTIEFFETLESGGDITACAYIGEDITAGIAVNPPIPMSSMQNYLHINKH